MIPLLKALHGIQRRIEVPAFLKHFALNRRICEVGVRFGYNLQQLLACDPQLCIGVDLYCDTDNKAENDTGLTQRKLDGIYQDVFKRFMGDPRVKIFRGYSVGAAQTIEPFSLDYVYIDANHTTEGTWNDINAWWPKIRQGGILAGHDYIEKESVNGVPFGVIEAVAKFRESHEIPEDCFHNTTIGYRSWFIVKQDGE